MKILIIGGGNMGLTFARSFLRSRYDVRVLEKQAARVEFLREELATPIFDTPESCVPEADIIVLAVKPQSAQALFDEIRAYVAADQLILTIMAGVSIETIRRALNTPKIIRAMPNLPAQIGEGMSVYTSTDEVTRIELVMVQNLLNTTGKALFVNQERFIDAGTAISGSGPAYVFFFMQALQQAAIDMGFTATQAQLLVGQTFRGAIHLFEQSDADCRTWIAKVASKGGTTERALQSFEAHRLAEAIKAGAQAALARAIELSRM